ncbi:MAG: hypothetical protein M5U08_13330 [Burkholderiales bacterium]|nr:hypothetical protein [Burkholderiales bacterium]
MSHRPAQTPALLPLHGADMSAAELLDLSAMIPMLVFVVWAVLGR